VHRGRNCSAVLLCRRRSAVTFALGRLLADRGGAGGGEHAAVGLLELGDEHVVAVALVAEAGHLLGEVVGVPATTSSRGFL